MSSSPSSIAALSIHDPKHFAIQLSQTEHRFALISKWSIPAGAKVLELGCGQGDCTAALADAVGSNGHVTAVDPAPLDYGAPYTLGQAQAHLSASPLGPRIIWVQADPLAFLESSGTKYDVAVLAHCIWYFSSPSVIADTLRLLAKHATRICLAEWSLSSTNAGGHAHVLAVLTQAALECHKPDSGSNVRTVVSPAKLKEIASEAGLTLESDALITPNAGVFDGRWEVGAVLDEEFVQEIESAVKDEREKSVVLALRDSVIGNVSRLENGTKGVGSMDVWTGVFAAKE